MMKNRSTISKKIEYPEECDGCCQRMTCNHDLEKCCYLLSNKECLIYHK